MKVSEDPSLIRSVSVPGVSDSSLTDVRGILVVNLLFLASGICKSQFIIQNGIEFFVGKGIFQVSVYAV